ncbi:MAG: ExeA family protein, partial [Candidatus Anammoxibacter sp.]
DTNLLYMSKQHTKALNHLRYGLLTEGFTLLTGEIGLGKTILCRQLLKSAGEGIRTAYIYNTYIGLLDLLKLIYHDFTGEVIESTSYSTCFNELNRFLIQMAENGEKVVVLIDEAQGLQLDVLEGLRQLSNLETEKKKLLSIIMVGQPEITTLLEKKSLRQLDQRISVRCVLKPLELAETRKYIYYRMALVTDKTSDVTVPHFSDFAMYLIHRFSRGVPRRINQICDRALLASFNVGKVEIGAWILQRAAREVLR